MSWLNLTYERQIIHAQQSGVCDGYQTKSLDTNGDGISEYTSQKFEDGSSLETFNFDSNSEYDARFLYDKDGNFVAGNFYDENGDIVELTPDEVIAYLDQAEELRKQAENIEYKEVKGFFDVQDELNKTLAEQE